MIDDLKKTLKGEKITTIENLKLSNGITFGAIKVISEITKRLGIKQALGYSEQAKSENKAVSFLDLQVGLVTN